MIDFSLCSYFSPLHGYVKRNIVNENRSSSKGNFKTIIPCFTSAGERQRKERRKMLYFHCFRSSTQGLKTSARAPTCAAAAA